MSASLPVDSIPDVATLEETAHASLFRRLLKNPTGVASLAFLLLLVVVALLAPVLATHAPNRAAALDILAPPRRPTNWIASTDRAGPAALRSTCL